MPLVLCENALVAGKYRLARLIGKGGMGEVWAATHTVTRQKVAIKFLGGDIQKTDDARRRFFREARAACAVKHPNVVTIHDVIEAEDQTPAIVMELFEGESLEAKLQREQKLSVRDTLLLLLPVVNAVGTAHSLGIVHRDIKPDNIFLAQTPEGVSVKVLDFGVAKFGIKEENGATGGLTNTGAMLGTPYYMSPEQAFGERLIDHRADLWSLGIVMYRCLTGQLPTKAENIGQILKIIMTRSIPPIAEVLPDIPPSLATLVTRLLAYTPAERPADLRAVKEVIESVLLLKGDDFGPALQDATSLAGVATPSFPRAAMEPRRRSPAAYAVFASLLFAGVTALTLATSRKPTVQASASAPIGDAVDAVSVAATAAALGPVSALPEPLVLPVTSDAPSVVSSFRWTAKPPATPSASVPVALPTATATSSLGGILEKPGY